MSESTPLPKPIRIKSWLQDQRPTASIQVNGAELADFTDAAAIEMRPADLPRLSLSMAAIDGIEIDIEQAVVRVDNIEIAGVDEPVLRELFERLKAKFR